MTEGKCHGCHQITSIRHCPLCDHWFCAACWPKWMDRASEFFKELVHGRSENCCGPLEVVVPPSNHPHASARPSPNQATTQRLTVEQRLASHIAQLTLVNAQQGVAIENLQQQLLTVTAERDEARAKCTESGE